jgi:hypothetical protein
MPTATLREHPDALGLVVESQSGSTARRIYDVDCSDATVHDWADAPELPGLGEIHSAAWSELVVVTRTPTYRNSQQVEVAIDYADRPPAGLFPTLPSGESYTVLDGFDVSVSIGKAVLVSTGLEVPLQRELTQLVGFTRVRVHRFYTATPRPVVGPSGIDLPRFNSLRWNKNVNIAAVNLPAVYNMFDGFTVAAGRLRYEDYEGPTREGNLLRVVHTMSLSPTDWHVPQRTERASAPPIEQVYRVYLLQSFAGIW